MASAKQRVTARRNIRKAAAAAQHDRTIAHLPAKIRTALARARRKSSAGAAAGLTRRAILVHARDLMRRSGSAGLVAEAVAQKLHRSQPASTASIAELDDAATAAK